MIARGLASDPDRLRSHLGLTQAYRRLGELERARRHAAEYVAMGGSEGELRGGLPED